MIRALLLVALLLARPAHAQAPPTPPTGSVLGGAASLSVGGSSARVALPASTGTFPFVTLANDGAAELFYRAGSSSVVATTMDFPVPAYGCAIGIYVGNATSVAAVSGGSATTLRVVQANGALPMSCPGVVTGGGGGGMATDAGNATAGAFAALVSAASVPTARGALGLGAANSPTFTGLTLSGLSTCGVLSTASGVVGCSSTTYMLADGSNAAAGAFAALVSAASAPTARASLGLDTGNSPTFTGLTLSGIASGSVLSATTGGLLQAASVTGSGSVVLATSPTLGTPTLGVASATTINKVTITTPASSATLTIGNTKTLAVGNSLTLTGTDGSSVAFGTGGTITTLAYSGTVADLGGLGTGIATFLGTPSSANLAAATTDETGTGALVFGTSPSLTTPSLGVATATSITVTGSSVPVNGLYLPNANIVGISSASNYVGSFGIIASTCGRFFLQVTAQINSSDCIAAQGIANSAQGITFRTTNSGSSTSSNFYLGNNTSPTAFGIVVNSSTNSSGNGINSSTINGIYGIYLQYNGTNALATTSGGHLTLEGVTSTGATGTGKFVFDTSPTISGAVLSGTTTLPGASASITNTGSVVLDVTQSYGLGTDALIFRDAAARLAQRNGTNAQIWRVYSTFTDVTNNAYAFMDAGRSTAGVFRFGTLGNGTGLGSFTGFTVLVDGVIKLDYGVTTLATWSTTEPFTFSSATLKMTALASDAATTDNSVCVATADGTLKKGSGTLGICLGTSSARFKHSILSGTSGLGAVMELKPVSYFYNKGYGDDGARQQFGFLAEDVVEAMPKLVGMDLEGRPNTVDMLGMIPAIVKAVQEQQVEIAELKKGSRL